MKIGIMQPYFIPYIGYWQLINEVDIFVIYDNIKYTKKGWINRNKLLSNNGPYYISIPITKDSDYLNINQRFISIESKRIYKSYLNRINNFYNKAPFFNEVYNLIKKILDYEESNLFYFLRNSIIQILSYLDIEKNILVSSDIKIKHNRKNEKRIVDICKANKAKSYINPIGGKDLYEKSYFNNNGINLSFIQTKSIKYKQFENNFVASLSIIDVLMFNSVNDTKKLLFDFQLK